METGIEIIAAENQKLREALEAIITKSEDRISSFANEIGDIAKEALKLKGGSDE